MKASCKSRRKPSDRLASSFSLTEKSVIDATVTDRRYNNRDEHSQTDILTSASNRLPAFPSRFCGTVALGICSRYSGATVPDFHRVPRHLTAMMDGQTPVPFKEQSVFTLNKNFAKKKIPKLFRACAVSTAITYLP